MPRAPSSTSDTLRAAGTRHLCAAGTPPPLPLPFTTTTSDGAQTAPGAWLQCPVPGPSFLPLPSVLLCASPPLQLPGEVGCPLPMHKIDTTGCSFLPLPTLLGLSVLALGVLRLTEPSASATRASPADGRQLLPSHGKEQQQPTLYLITSRSRQVQRGWLHQAGGAPAGSAFSPSACLGAAANLTRLLRLAAPLSQTSSVMHHGIGSQWLSTGFQPVAAPLMSFPRPSPRDLVGPQCA